MKVYQCIHKYPPHIPLFEKKYGVTGDMDFESLRSLIIQDGYASSYILLPALQNKIEDVFYTVWNYERLQLLWAREHGLKTNDLDEIKLAQLEEYMPNVFYNMSPFCDNGFIKKLGKRAECKRVYWNGFIEREPRTFPGYDGQLSLHRPYVEYWKSKGLAACELQPAIPEAWGKYTRADKSIDVLFYGQFDKAIFGSRNKLIEKLLHYKLETGRDIRCHLQFGPRRRFVPPFLAHYKIPRIVKKYALPPLYGEDLYKAIGQARIVVNAYTDNNQDFKSNMRLFEATGLGAFLVSEDGVYPDGCEPGVDFYTYKNVDGLISQIERVLTDWTTHAEIARRTQNKFTLFFNKERQWNEFKSFISIL
jgi:hypothetical protein